MMELKALVEGYKSGKQEAPAALTTALAAAEKAASPKSEPNDMPEDGDDEEPEDEEDKPTAGGNTPGSFAHVAALVPEGQHFTEEAFTNEGIWLTGAHLVAVENKLRSFSATVKKLTASLASANETGEGANVSLAETQQQLTDANAQIVQLQQENARLKGKDGSAPAKPASVKKDAPLSTGPGNDLAKAKTKWDLSLEQQASQFNR